MNRHHYRDILCIRHRGKDRKIKVLRICIRFYNHRRLPDAVKHFQQCLLSQTMVMHSFPEIPLCPRLFRCLHHRIDMVAGHQHREISNSQDLLEAVRRVLDVDVALLTWMLQGVLDSLLQGGPFGHFHGIPHLGVRQFPGSAHGFFLILGRDTERIQNLGAQLVRSFDIHFRHRLGGACQPGTRQGLL